jgi:protein TonB
MNFIFEKHPNRNIYFLFILSLLIHFLLFILPRVFLSQNVKNTELKRDAVFIQIAPAHSQVVPVTHEKVPPKPKELPKEVQTKKLIQKTVVPQPAPVVSAAPEISPASLPHPSSIAGDKGDVSIAAVSESVVDEPARCVTPEIPITEDAANAGVTSGKVVLQVQISSEGKVVSATLLKGTGFRIDEEVLQQARKMVCEPARKDGKSVAVVKRVLWKIVR